MAPASVRRYRIAAMASLQPSFRKLAGIAVIMLLIVVLAAVVASLAPIVGKWPVLVQGAFYLAMGIAWIVPLRPLLRWTETGRWRDRSKPTDPGR